MRDHRTRRKVDKSYRNRLDNWFTAISPLKYFADRLFPHHISRRRNVSPPKIPFDNNRDNSQQSKFAADVTIEKKNDDLLVCHINRRKLK